MIAAALKRLAHRVRRGLAPAAGREGFSLIEVLLALFIFSVGVLGLAASTGYVGIQIRVADLDTERAAAIQSSIESLRLVQFHQVQSRSSAQALAVGRFQVWWDVVHRAQNLKDVNVITSGPGYLPSGGWSDAVMDTVFTSIAR